MLFVTVTMNHIAISITIVTTITIITAILHIVIIIVIVITSSPEPVHKASGTTRSC